MLNSITIENYKSIQKQTFDLKRVNVFIGKNGCGKSNVLEAVAMASEALANHSIEIENLSNRGVRITKPTMTLNSFLGYPQKRFIIYKVSTSEKSFDFYLGANDNDIFSSWNTNFPKVNGDKIANYHTELLDEHLSKLLKITILTNETNSQKEIEDQAERDDMLTEIQHIMAEITNQRNVATLDAELSDFTIYSINTQTLRGLANNSKRQPLGIYGEGLDLLLQVMSKEEKEELYANMDLIDWLDRFEIHADSEYLGEGHKLVRSSSSLYFKDRFMQKKNNVFSAENANEGALHVLFYLALIISKRTPSIFAIDNIESSLNPKLCTEVMKRIMTLAEKHNKQILITTHNPAILDGINLNSDQQALFVVDRNDQGMTVASPIKTKKELKNKLSELWMSGVLGGVPTNF